eukprot:229967-Rhodomonas_salina.1
MELEHKVLLKSGTNLEYFATGAADFGTPAESVVPIPGAHALEHRRQRVAACEPDDLRRGVPARPRSACHRAAARHSHRICDPSAGRAAVLAQDRGAAGGSPAGPCCADCDQAEGCPGRIAALCSTDVRARERRVQPALSRV